MVHHSGPIFSAFSNDIRVAGGVARARTPEPNARQRRLFRMAGRQRGS
jgi:hypothetical protein